MVRAEGRRIASCVLVLAGLLACGGFLAAAAVSTAAHAVVLTDPTTATTTTTPSPDPAPTTTPAPKPAPKPAPRPVVHSSPAPAPVVHTSTPRFTPSATPTHAVVRPHKIARHQKLKPRHKRHAAPKPAPTPPVGQVLGDQTTRIAPVAVVTSSGANLVRPLILVLLVASLLMFGVGATPAHYIPWRRAGHVLQERHLEFTLFGVAFLAIALFTLVLTRGV